MTVLNAGVDSLLFIFKISQILQTASSTIRMLWTTTLTLYYIFKYFLYHVNNNNLEQYFLGVSFYQTSSTYKGFDLTDN